MEMTLRWYGSAFDTVTLGQIRQIPGVTGVITTLYGAKAGEVWEREKIRRLAGEVESIRPAHCRNRECECTRGNQGRTA